MRNSMEAVYNCTTEQGGSVLRCLLPKPKHIRWGSCWLVKHWCMSPMKRLGICEWLGTIGRNTAIGRRGRSAPILVACILHSPILVRRGECRSVAVSWREALQCAPQGMLHAERAAHRQRRAPAESWPLWGCDPRAGNRQTGREAAECNGAVGDKGARNRPQVPNGRVQSQRAVWRPRQQRHGGEQGVRGVQGAQDSRWPGQDPLSSWWP
mmetsp:Transcript_101207/g.325147  ORF Transcript_101207/g.325147 Transcript_101207/m.325147 type:complete len:210 (-) Transcript_101207:1057-1686(-)